MSNIKPVTTPLIPWEHLQSSNSEEQSTFDSLVIKYRSAIVRMNYLRMATRPSLSCAISALSQYLEAPGIQNWRIFLHAIKYMKEIQDVGLFYCHANCKGIVSYSNADWGNCKETCQSISGYLDSLNGNLVLWKEKKRPLVSISTAETEYKSVCDIVSEFQWL
ncbi:hypothetical protein O181_010685 [Austropuccinia psidii MF-1]|uniref:Uncharacterized protein n=1 Tax=Austropuccinia psidii MF-1 TaxID=1389203 RepID=A0A9Q3BUD5_9BASI|nr:hypothetical protein [Austropuccinia psidii MF-1]